MKSSNPSSVFLRLIAFSITISVLCVQTMVAFALPTNAMAGAEITVTGPSDGGEKPFVLVNGERALNGRTFFTDGAISTTETSSAMIDLGKLGRIALAPSSSLSLGFSEGRIAGRLSKGNATVSNMDGVSVKIDTPHDSIINEGNAASRFSVAVLGGQTSVTVENGTVRYSNGAKIASKQNDDDDDDWKGWAAVALIAGIIAVVVVIIATSDDDDDTVSPVR